MPLFSPVPLGARLGPSISIPSLHRCACKCMHACQGSTYKIGMLLTANKTCSGIHGEEEISALPCCHDTLPHHTYCCVRLLRGQCSIYLSSEQTCSLRAWVHNDICWCRPTDGTPISGLRPVRFGQTSTSTTPICNNNIGRLASKICALF